MDKPFSQACENNKQPILDVIAPVYKDVDRVLEIGSGTGQHAVFFAQHLPHLRWLPSDQPEYLPGIEAWREESGLPNVAPPLELDVRQPWPVDKVPAVFSANTVHIMHWPQVEQLFEGLSQHLSEGGVFCLYGPFNYHGKYTSDSNARFDAWLRQRDPGSGIRDIEDIEGLANTAGLTLQADYAMPANNRLLYFLRA